MRYETAAAVERGARADIGKPDIDPADLNLFLNDAVPCCSAVQRPPSNESTTLSTGGTARHEVDRDGDALEFKHLVEYIREHVVVRRNARGGRSAGEHLIAALRCLYQHAIADGHVHETANPARKVDKPRRLTSTRRAIPDTGLADINQVAANTGNDPELNTLILRLHTETACRRGGALALRLTDLASQQSLIRLHEKGDTVRWQPVSRH